MMGKREICYNYGSFWRNLVRVFRERDLFLLTTLEKLGSETNNH